MVFFLWLAFFDLHCARDGPINLAVAIASVGGCGYRSSSSPTRSVVVVAVIMDQAIDVGY